MLLQLHWLRTAMNYQRFPLFQLGGPIYILEAYNSHKSSHLRITSEGQAGVVRTETQRIIFGLTSLIAVTSACAVGSVFLKTMLWQLTTISSLWTTTAPNGPPSPHLTALYASSTALVKNLWSLSGTEAGLKNTKNEGHDNYRRMCDMWQMTTAYMSIVDGIYAIYSASRPYERQITRTSNS